MKISKSQKKFIKANYKNFHLLELSEKSGLSEKEITTYLRETGRYDTIKTSEEISTKIKSIQEIINFLKANFEIVAALVIVTFLVYLNSLNGQFVSDDIPGFVLNPQVKSFAELVKNFHLQQLIQTLSYTLFELNPLPLHIISVLFHIVAAILVFVFVNMLFGKRIGAITAFLFALHPVNTEAVAWISGFNYIFNGSIFLLTAIFYSIYKSTNKKVYALIAFAIYTGALFLTNFPWTVTIFPLLLITDQLFIEEKITSKKVLRILIFILPTILFLLFFQGNISGRLSTVGVASIAKANAWDFVNRFTYTIYESLKLLFFPKDLTLYHEGEIISKEKLILMYATTISLFTLVLVLWKKYRRLAGLILFFLASISLALSPIQIAWFVAERYLYIGSIAFCILMALIFLKLEAKSKINGLALTLTLLVSIIYGIRVVIRNIEWSTPKSLWLATARVSPRSTKAHNNLGDIYGREGDRERSIQEFKIAIGLDPNHADSALHNLGNAYLRMGELNLAEEQFKKAIQINPDLYQSYLNLGIIEYKKGNVEKAREYFEKVLQIDPTNLDAKRVLEELKD